MWIITHDKEHVRELSDAERNLVIRHSDGSLRGAEQAHAARLLRDVRSASHWLGCDCAKPMPIMNIALRDTGTLVLRNNSTGAAHASTCPLIKQESDADGGGRSRQEFVDRVQPESILSLHGDFASDSSSPGQAPSRTGLAAPARKKKKLLSLLMTVFEAAGLHEFDPANEKDLTTQFQRLREALWRFSLAPGVPAQSYSDSRIDKARLARLAKSLRESTSFGEHRKYGLMTDVVAGISARKIALQDGTEMGMFGHVERWDDAHGPMLVLATVATQTPKSGFFEIGKVASIPVLSGKTFLPVAGDAEREQIESLLDLLRWLYREHKIRVTLRRHLFGDDLVIDLQGRGRQLKVDLTAGGIPGAPPSPSILSLDDFGGDMSQLKRKVSGFFRKDS